LKPSNLCWLGALAAILLLACAEAEDPQPNGGTTAAGAGGSGGTAAGGSGALGAAAPVGGAGATGGGGAEGGAGGSGDEGGSGGAPACDPAGCQVDINSIASMPVGTTTLNFETCTGGCACCGGGTYNDPITSDCITCSLDATLLANGITRSGGLGTYFVDCIVGNADAPIEHAALFAGGNTVVLDFADGVSFVGFSALPSSSDSLPTVTLEGYTSTGELSGIDTFDFLTPGGDCATSNPAVRFFGFRGCCGEITQVVATFSDGNTGIDSLSFF